MKHFGILVNMRPPIQDDINAYIKSGVRDSGGSYRYLGVDDKLMIIWGFYREWGNRRTASFAKVSISTVKNYKFRIVHDPQSIFEEMPLYTQIDSRKFLCRLCRERRPTRVQVMRHILAHIFPPELWKPAPLTRVTKPV